LIIPAAYAAADPQAVVEEIDQRRQRWTGKQISAETGVSSRGSTSAAMSPLFFKAPNLFGIQ
jgi:hypothetical protein